LLKVSSILLPDKGAAFSATEMAKVVSAIFVVVWLAEDKQ
jgi:hypothetical protein